jgi:8-oxo-dGTP pyrophosphatase MutT (NUDIX family)
VTEPAAPRPGSPGGPLWDPSAIPAATVVVVRDGAAGLEVLMLRRDRDLAFAGGTWVFPGGRIDPTDRPEGQPDLERAARAAAVREAHEEAGLTIDPAGLHRWSHWTPPPQSPRRFTTAFFIAALDPGAAEVVVDDGEIREHRWRRPAEMLELRDAGQVSLTPPTAITLHQLLPCADAAAAVSAAPSVDRVEHFATRITIDGDAVIALYHGDVGYETGDHLAPGPRHRLVMGPRWSYERTP